MTIIILLIGISLTIAVIFLGVFFWNMKTGQYDDTYTPSVRMLFDDKSKKQVVKPNQKTIVHERFSDPKYPIHSS
jgi:cbb3-type cytochrome oxidase maturation protein